MKKNTEKSGFVYLLHFSKKFHHAQHYIGYTGKESFQDRLDRHLRGDGSRLVRAVVQAGIKVTLARGWSEKNRKFERKLKNRKNAKRLCPICNGKGAWELGNYLDD